MERAWETLKNFQNMQSMTNVVFCDAKHQTQVSLCTSRPKTQIPLLPPPPAGGAGDYRRAPPPRSFSYSQSQPPSQNVNPSNFSPFPSRVTTR